MQLRRSLIVGESFTSLESTASLHRYKQQHIYFFAEIQYSKKISILKQNQYQEDRLVLYKLFYLLKAALFLWPPITL